MLVRYLRVHIGEYIVQHGLIGLSAGVIQRIGSLKARVSVP
jgi:hypothetical protein